MIVVDSAITLSTTPNIRSPLYMKFYNVHADACTLYPQSGQKLGDEDDIELAKHEVIAFECIDSTWVISM